MSKPLWFLDVDGVINMFPDDRPGALLAGLQEFKASPNLHPKMSREEVEEAKWRYGGTRQFSIMYDPTITKRIASLHQSGQVEVVWLTTWGSGANGELGHGLKFPQLRCAGEPTYRTTGLNHTADDGRWWKWGCIERFLDAHPEVDKFVWTDDDLAIELNAGAWARSIGGLTIAPDMVYGLTHDDLDTIEAYLTTSDVQLTTDSVK